MSVLIIVKYVCKTNYRNNLIFDNIYIYPL